mmetsp:Transcript_31919/g.75846  ORF Transcript_31919/g.75846 Transcript_31919/m.75846 type:complete len:392 (-) Transcript_31919:83-1258(-)
MAGNIRDSNLYSSAIAHGPASEVSCVKGWPSPQDFIKGRRGWCGGAYYSSFAPESTESILKKSTHITRLAGKETGFQAMTNVRQIEPVGTPGPGSYEIQNSFGKQSCRRPDSGPKTFTGYSIREQEVDRFRRHNGIVDPTGSNIGPGHYSVDKSKDRTQFRRLQQPVTANYKPRLTRRAECQSVNLMMGHHWRDLMPRVGEISPGHNGNESFRPTTTKETTSPEYREYQANLDARLSKPKQQVFLPFRYPQATLAYQLIGPTGTLFQPNRTSEVLPQQDCKIQNKSQHTIMKNEASARAPSAPPQDFKEEHEQYNCQEFGPSLRAQHSEGTCSQQRKQSYSRITPKVLVEGEHQRAQAVKAAEKAAKQEQRRMEWQVRSSYKSEIPWVNLV